MSRWAKLHAKVSDSYDFADAHARDPNAALLFLLALPQADVFGVLPGHPGLLRGKLCGLLALTDAQVEAAFGVLCDCGMMRAYADSKGRPMYIIPGYEQHQDVRWDRVGRPEHDLPADWEPSEEFERAIGAAPNCVLAAWMRDRSRSGPGVVPEQSGLDVDVDTDTEQPSAPPATADDASSEPAKEDTLAQKLAKAAWALFGQDGTPPGNVFAAAQQLVDAHGDKCKDLYRHIRDTEDRDLKGAKPGTKVAAVLRSWISEGKRFLWDPSAQPRAKTAGGAALPLPDDDPDPFHAMQRREGVRA